MTSWREAASVIVQYAGRAVSGSAAVGRFVTCATLSVAETLLKTVSSGLAHDIGRLKTSMLDEQEAKAALTVARAAKAANANTLQKQWLSVNALETKLKLQKLRAQLNEGEEKRCVRAELAEIARKDAERKRAALERLKDSLSRITQQGGNVFFSVADLTKLLDPGDVDVRVDNVPLDGAAKLPDSSSHHEDLAELLQRKLWECPYCGHTNSHSKADLCTACGR